MILEPGFLDHWKTRLLASRTGNEAAPLAVLRLWEYCQLRRATRLQLTPRSLAGICRWTGDPESLWDAMTDPDAGFLDPTTEAGTWEVHDFEAMNARLVRCWRPRNKSAETDGRDCGKSKQKQTAKQDELRGTVTTKETATRGTDTQTPPDIAEPRGKDLDRIGEGEEEVKRERTRASHDGNQRPDIRTIEIIVAAYPKREAMHESLPAVAAAIDAGEDPAAILQAVKGIAAAITRFPGGALNRHVPSAMRFFQGRRWHDDPQVWIARAEGKNETPTTKRTRTDASAHTPRW